MYFEQYKHIIRNAMNQLNGKMNKLLLCHNYSFDYADYDPAQARSDCDTGTISYNLVAMAKDFKGLENGHVIASCIHTVAHELSHLDQDVNTNRYCNDRAYHAWIEKTNDLHAVKFLFDNMNMVQTFIGNYDFGFLSQINKEAQIYGTGFVPVTKEKLISKVMNYYIAGMGKTLDDFKTVVLCLEIEETRSTHHLVIKQGNFLIDPNQLFQLTYHINKYESCKCNYQPVGNDSINIKISLNHIDKRLEPVLYRVPREFIA